MTTSCFYVEINIVLLPVCSFSPPQVQLHLLLSFSASFSVIFYCLNNKGYIISSFLLSTSTFLQLSFQLFFTLIRIPGYYAALNLQVVNHCLSRKRELL